MKILIFLETLLLFSPIVFAIQPVHLELYYESLCPDCSGFIINQLLPTWNKLKNTSAAFTLSMFPFGNARETELTNGTFVYHCQHGEEECKGNLLEICIIKNCQFDPNSYLHILTCVEIQVMAGHSFETSVPACVKLFRSTKSYEWIKECSEGPEGKRLMHKLAVRTASLIPKHTWVPWIVIDGVFRKEYQDQAVENLQKLICKLSNGPQPAECI